MSLAYADIFRTWMGWLPILTIGLFMLGFSKYVNERENRVVFKYLHKYNLATLAVLSLWVNIIIYIAGKEYGSGSMAVQLRGMPAGLAYVATWWAVNLLAMLIGLYIRKMKLDRINLSPEPVSVEDRVTEIVEGRERKYRGLSYVCPICASQYANDIKGTKLVEWIGKLLVRYSDLAADTWVNKALIDTCGSSYCVETYLKHKALAEYVRTSRAKPKTLVELEDKAREAYDMMLSRQMEFDAEDIARKKEDKDFLFKLQSEWDLEYGNCGSCADNKSGKCTALPQGVDGYPSVKPEDTSCRSIRPAYGIPPRPE